LIQRLPMLQLWSRKINGCRQRISWSCSCRTVPRPQHNKLSLAATRVRHHDEQESPLLGMLDQRTRNSASGSVTVRRPVAPGGQNGNEQADGAEIDRHLPDPVKALDSQTIVALTERCNKRSSRAREQVDRRMLGLEPQDGGQRRSLLGIAAEGLEGFRYLVEFRHIGSRHA